MSESGVPKLIKKAIVGRLNYSVYTCDLLIRETENIAVWVFVTEGMKSIKQSELVFILKMSPSELTASDPSEVIPVAPPALFSGLFVGASLNSIHLMEGYVHSLGERGFIKPEFKGLLFQPLILNMIPGGIFNDDEDYLTVLILFDTELHIANTCTPTRVLADLGRREKIYPYPIFFDRDREPLYPHRITHTDSLLLKAPHIKFPEIHCVLLDNENKVIIKIPNYAAEVLKKEIDKISLDSVVIIPTHFSEMEDSHICWNPSQNAEVDRNQLEIFLAPLSKGKKIGGSFIGFVPEQSQDETIIYEDGFLMMLSDGSWGLLRKCLGRATNCYVQSDTPKGLHAEISFYGDAPEEMHELQNQIMVLTPKEELVNRIDTEELGSYTQSVIDALTSYLKTDSTGWENVNKAILQFELHPQNPLELKIAFRPATISVTPSVRQKIGTIVQSIELPKVREGQVQFQIYFTPS